jgi:DNA-binding transcriptional ArsR family regulator
MATRRDYERAVPRAWKGVARVFVALGDEHRQRMLLLFGKGERLTPGQIAAVSTLSRPAVAHHLKILREAGILDAEKVGKEVFLSINRDRLAAALEGVLDYVREET